MTVEVGKLVIGKLENIQSGLNSLKSKVVDLDVDKMKNVPVEMKTLSDAVDKNTVYKTENVKLKSKVTGLELEILIHLLKFT